MLLLGAIALLFLGQLGRTLDSAMDQGEKIEKLANGARFARVNFQRQVKEWKNMAASNMKCDTIREVMSCGGYDLQTSGL